MTENWFRWHVGTSTDPKFKTIAVRAGARLAEVLSVWAMMLECAAQASPPGCLDGWDDEDVAAHLGMARDDVEAIRAAMQGKTLDGDALRRWSRRQPKREDGSADRARAWREARKAEALEAAAAVTNGAMATVDEVGDTGEQNATERDRTQPNAGERDRTPEEIRGDKKERKITPPAHAGPPLREPDEAGEGDGVAGAPLTDEPRPKPKRGTRLPRDWTPTDEDRSFAKQRGFTEEQIDDLRDEFRDYWSGVAGARGVKLDWSGTWRNRVRDRSGGGSGPAGGNDRRGGRQGSSSFLEAAARFAARHS